MTDICMRFPQMSNESVIRGVAIAKSIKKMHERGFLDRNAPHWKNVIVQPNEKLTMITTGSGSDKCIELLRMIFLNTSDGVRELIKRTREDVDSEANWTIETIGSWRKEFFVELPEMKFTEVDSIFEQVPSAKPTKVNDENIFSASITNSIDERDDEDDDEIEDEIEDEMEDESEID